jgi:glycosyltransferase involved in cell wall biosynthesis
MIQKIIKKWLKPNGISVLLAAQNEEETIQLCVESFLGFGDEIIIVTNGSTDNTRKICKKLMEEYPQKIQFYDKPDLADLHHNRAFALTKAKYRWIAKFDADFVAYTEEDGELSISNLRNTILQTFPFWFISFKVALINIYRSLTECGLDIKIEKKIYIAPPFTAMHKIFLNTPLLAFKRVGRWEHIPYNRFYWKKNTKGVSFFHLTLNSDTTLFRRSERTNWREHGDFEKYPILDEYIKKYVLPIKYQMTLEKAINNYVENDILPYIQNYDETKYHRYPKSLRRIIDNKV